MRRGIVRISEQQLKEILGLEGNVVSARMDYFTGDYLELVINDDPRMPEYFEGQVPLVINYRDLPKI